MMLPVIMAALREGHKIDNGTLSIGPNPDRHR